jgi:hypothetical protein
MVGRIGTLDVRYLTRGTDPLVAASLPGLTRALERDLAEAIDRRWTATLGDAGEVFVVRELRSTMAIDVNALVLDRQVIDSLSRTYGDALARRLAVPDDDVVRFADTPEFIASFIADEMAGRAAERWYYGAFRRHRSADTRLTIEAVLAAHPREAPAVLGRLARRGCLDALLALLGASRIGQLVAAGLDRVDQDRDVLVLIDAALELVSALGWRASREARALVRHALVIERGHDGPEWSDRQRVTEFVWDLVERAVAMLEGRSGRREAFDREALAALLRGSLDWLGGDWLLAASDQLAPGLDRNSPHISADPLTAILERIESALADGRVRIASSDSIEEAVVRLIAAAELGVQDAPIVAALRRLIEQVVREWRRVTAAEALSDVTGTEASPSISQARSVRSVLTPAARTLTAKLVAKTVEQDAGGTPTAGAGLYLMIRAVLDAGLPGLAQRLQVPLAPLLAGVAHGWLGIDLTTDGPAIAWTGAEAPGDADIARLTGLEPNLHELEAALRERLEAQRGSLSSGDEERAPAVDDALADVHESCARIGTLIMQAWSRWLRGLESSSTSFLVDRCLRRAGRVRQTETDITVVLEPAAFDVVIAMAGYFKPIEMVPWLGGRSVVLDVVRRFVA